MGTLTYTAGEVVSNYAPDCEVCRAIHQFDADLPRAFEKLADFTLRCNNITRPLLIAELANSRENKPVTLVCPNHGSRATVFYYLVKGIL
jgi:hypothetical protein